MQLLVPFDQLHVGVGVLLTRGRDGFIVFIPPVDKLDSVYELLLSVGIKLIKNRKY